MLIDDWKRNIILINTVFSFVSNTILLYFIVKYSRRHIGGYRYLLATFAIFNIVFSTVQAAVIPVFHIYHQGWVVFPAGQLFLRDQNFGYFGLVLYCQMYCLCLVLLNYHFVYRYILICHDEYMYLLRNRYSALVLLGIWLMNGVVWGIVCRFTMYHWDETKNYMRASLLKSYNIDADKIAMLGPIYFHQNADGISSANWISCLGSIYCVTLMVFCFGTIVFCSLRINSVLLKSRMSDRARRLQKDLFKALVIQFLVPAFSEFLPGTVMFTSPLFGISLEKVASLAAVLASFNSVLEPLFLLYFVKDYRYAFMKMTGQRDNSGTYFASETHERVDRSLSNVLKKEQRQVTSSSTSK
ncbi:unnamed protein product, partial [Mesorhabditis belari]|uniref:G-protein coupled receptors family 1 profile domain-containing protein n=1 Tax=Mesorhabditis belari TaxID=2138241 RepID=A0AAF3JAE6_9BILA